MMNWSPRINYLYFETPKVTMVDLVTMSYTMIVAKSRGSCL